LLLKLLGAHVPVDRWPNQLTRQQKKDQAREAAQSDAAAADRPTRSDEFKNPAEDEGMGNVVPLRWPDRGRQAQTALDDERRHRRRQAVPQRPAAPGRLGDRLRRTSMLLIPDEEPDGPPEDSAGSGEAR
jgi:hypothetical protein